VLVRQRQEVEEVPRERGRLTRRGNWRDPWRVTSLGAPDLLGGGKPFFPALDHPLAVKLVETRTFADGVVLLRYERVV
jgi:hypothetical protein